MANITLEEAKEAVDVLSSPDPDTLTQTAEGRRIERCEQGWRIVNWQHYRVGMKQKLEDLQERVEAQPVKGYVYYASSVDASRVKIGFSKNPWSRVAELKVAIPSISIIAIEPGTTETERHRHAMFSELRLDGEWFKIDSRLAQHITTLSSVATVGPTTPPSPSPSPSPTQIHSSEIVRIYEEYPRKVGRPKALEAIRKAVAKHGCDFVRDRTTLYAKTYDGDPKFIPYPTTFFNQERYNDDPATWKSVGHSKVSQKPNPRNVGIAKGPTDYAEAAKRKLERQALEADNGQPPDTKGT